MSNEDDTIWVTYNGELYNELELRKELEAKGHRYRTACDTESLVHLYEEEGLDFVRRLNGMFALAIWDSKRGRLVLVRDRMGQKPLFYGELARRWACVRLRAQGALGTSRDRPHARSSEPGALPVLRIRAGARTRSGGRSESCPAAMSWPGKAGSFRVWRYWNPPEPAATRSHLDFEATAGRFWKRLRRVGGAPPARRTCRSAYFFRGALIRRASRRPSARSSRLAACTRSRSDSKTRASTRAGMPRAVADHLGTDHHERTFSIETVYQLLPEVAGWLDEPFGDASILPTHLLSRFARQEVKVVLGGDGADELLAGYPTFVAERAAGVFRRLAAAGAGAGRRGGPAAASGPSQFQLRLQAQAVSPGRG